jgi:predicted peroxiredoxin
LKQHLAILLWATDPDAPHLCATPFFHASAAAAMDIEVEVFFTSKSIRLLEKGVADHVYVGEGKERSVAGYMREAHGHGAKFFACSQAMAAHGVREESLIPEVAGHAGAAAFMARALDESWATLSY